MSWGEEVGYAFPLRSIDRVWTGEGKFSRTGKVEVNEEEIIAPVRYRNRVDADYLKLAVVDDWESSKQSGTEKRRKRVELVSQKILTRKE